MITISCKKCNETTLKLRHNNDDNKLINIACANCGEIIKTMLVDNEDNLVENNIYNQFKILSNRLDDIEKLLNKNSTNSFDEYYGFSQSYTNNKEEEKVKDNNLYLSY